MHNHGVTLSNIGKDAWFIGNMAELNLKDKIEKIGKPLKQWDVKINFGIKTGLNEAFIIDTETRNRLVAEEPKISEIIKPILRGRDIQRFTPEWGGLWLIAFFPALHLNIDNYPTIKVYLLSNFSIKQLDQSGKKYPDLNYNARKLSGNKWFETQDNIAYYPEFEKEKLVWKRIGSILRFGYDLSGIYCQDSTCIMTGKNLKYLCAYMNSRLGNQLLVDKAPKTGTGDLIVSVQAIDPLLVPPITTNNQPIIEKIESLVDEILTLKKENKKIDIQEREIDQLVYQLYDLTPEEIAIIEKQR